MTSLRTGSLNRNRFQSFAAFVFLCCAVYFSYHWIAHKDGVRMRDFLAPYTGSRCLWAACNPYDTAQIQREFSRAGGLEADHPVWAFEPAVYPPSALVVLLPISFMPYHAARAVWYGLTASLLFTALLAIVSMVESRGRPWALLLAAFTYWSEPVGLLLNIGQPSGVAVSLAVLSLWLELKKKHSLAAVICLGMSLALKPQLAGLLFFYLLILPRFRPLALKGGAAAVALLAIGVVWLSLSPHSHDWRSDYRAQIVSSESPGGVNDPRPDSGYALQFTGAQAAFALFDNAPDIDNWSARGLGGCLFLLWLLVELKNGEADRMDFAALGAIVCIGLLPVYHREYDLVLLMISFPAVIQLLVRMRRLAWPVLFCTLCLLSSPHFHHIWIKLKMSAQMLRLLPPESIRALVFTRWQPVLLVILACSYILAMRNEKLINANEVK